MFGYKDTLLDWSEHLKNTIFWLLWEDQTFETITAAAWEESSGVWDTMSPPNQSFTQSQYHVSQVEESIGMLFN